MIFFLSGNDDTGFRLDRCNIRSETRPAYCPNGNKTHI